MVGQRRQGLTQVAFLLHADAAAHGHYGRELAAAATFLGIPVCRCRHAVQYMKGRSSPVPSAGRLVWLVRVPRVVEVPSVGKSTMSLALYGHPFSSYTQKVLIALYEN